MRKWLCVSINYQYARASDGRQIRASFIDLESKQYKYGEQNGVGGLQKVFIRKTFLLILEKSERSVCVLVLATQLDCVMASVMM